METRKRKRGREEEYGREVENIFSQCKFVLFQLVKTCAFSFKLQSSSVKTIKMNEQTIRLEQKKSNKFIRQTKKSRCFPVFLFFCLSSRQSNRTNFTRGKFTNQPNETWNVIQTNYKSFTAKTRALRVPTARRNRNKMSCWYLTQWWRRWQRAKDAERNYISTFGVRVALLLATQSQLN